MERQMKVQTYPDGPVIAIPWVWPPANFVREEQEEEEEEQIMTKIIHKDIVYYRDSEDFIFSNPEEDTPIGYMHKRSKTIKFY